MDQKWICQKSEFWARVFLNFQKKYSSLGTHCDFDFQKYGVFQSHSIIWVKLPIIECYGLSFRRFPPLILRFFFSKCPISKPTLALNDTIAEYQQVNVVSEPERIDVFLTRSCVQLTDISCGVVYKATLASLVLFRSYCQVSSLKRFFSVCFWGLRKFVKRWR